MARTISSDIVISGLEKLGFTCSIIAKDQNLFLIEKGGNKILSKNVDFGLNTALSVKLADNKELTYSVLGVNNLPVPRSEYHTKGQELVLPKFTGPYVVKPIDTDQGIGVSIGVNNETLTNAIDYSFEFTDRLVIQEQFFGDDYRVVILDEMIVAVTKRTPPIVFGDGHKTIGELIEVENKNILRGDGHTNPLSKIKLDNPLVQHISKDGYTVDSVIGKGVCVMLRKNANLSTGGNSVNLPLDIHPDNIVFCKKAVEGITGRFCAVDIVCKDLMKPLGPGNGGIIELNTTPGLRMHAYPAEGEPIDIGLILAKKVEEEFFGDIDVK